MTNCAHRGVEEVPLYSSLVSRPAGRNVIVYLYLTADSLPTLSLNHNQADLPYQWEIYSRAPVIRPQTSRGRAGLPGDPDIKWSLNVIAD